jgi:hypothetical protein
MIPALVVELNGDDTRVLLEGDISHKERNVPFIR